MTGSPPVYTLRLRRFDPESGESPYWQEFTVALEGHRSVLDAILKRRDEGDGTIGIRCSCRAAICGSCGVRINDKPGLACHTHLERAAQAAPDGSRVIQVEPMGNMPVIRDLIASTWTRCTGSMPVILTALLRRKITLGHALLHPNRRRFKGLRRLLDPIEQRERRYELNLYVSGYDGEEPAQIAGSGPAMVATGTSAMGRGPARRREGKGP